MLQWLVATCLRQRVLVLALAAVLMVLGVRTAQGAPFDVFPEFAPPLVEVQTEAPGLSTEEVESLVTVPLESALNGVTGLATIRSKSVLGLSSVVLLFETGTDLARARQAVQERLPVAAATLPSVCKAPVMLPPLSSLSRVLKIGMSSPTHTQTELTVLARWTVRPRLLAVPGVANVAIWGERDPQLQVLVDPERLHAHGVSLDRVVLATREAVVAAAGGFVDLPNQRIPVRHVAAAASAEALGQALVEYRGGVPLRLADVAEVRMGNPPPIGDAIIDDGPGLLLIVEKQPAANTLAVTRGVEAALAALPPALPGVKMDATIFRPATFIESALDNLGRALWLSCALVAIVLVGFLADWRTAAISLFAIPLSLVAAVVALRASGATFDTMVLAGLVIAVGEVVDDAVIDVENILRRLRLARAAGSKVPTFQVVLQASLEVRSAVVYASLVVMLVFLPVFFLPGTAGSFFRPLGLGYLLAILASLVVALTVTPALSLLLLPRVPVPRREPALTRGLRTVYAWILPRVLTRPRGAVAILAALLLATAGAVPFLGEEFLPEFQERDFLMHWVGKPGTSLDAMGRVTAQVSRELRGIPGVRNFGSHIGRAEVADEVVGPNFAELWISVAADADLPRTVQRIQETVDGYPGLFRDVLTYLKERTKEVLTGTSAAVVVRIFGPELPVLRSKAEEVGRTIAQVPGVTHLKVEPQVLVPQIEVRLKADVAARVGLTAGAVRQALTTLVRGTTVGEIPDGQRLMTVAVWGVPERRDNLSSLRALQIEAPGGAQVRLGEVADLTIVPAPNEIKREGASRRIDVTCNVQGRDLGSVAREIGQRIRNVGFPPGYHPEVLGEYAARSAARAQLVGLAAGALVMIFLLLVSDFGSLRHALLVFATLPFALVGGVAAAFAGGGVLSLGSLIGMMTVLGIAARNGIMLVSHMSHLEREEGMAFGTELVMRGAMERLLPILMTALATGLALLPLVLGGAQAGHEIERPMAIVIVGGLCTSTALNLVLLPALYLAWGRRPGTSGSP